MPIQACNLALCHQWEKTMELWRKSAGQNSAPPLFDEAVLELCIATDYGGGSLGLAHVMPIPTDQRDAVTRCEIILPDQALITLETIEYQGDPQGGNWPMSNHTSYCGAADFTQLSADLRLLETKKRRESRRTIQMHGNWRELRVWIGTGEKLRATPHFQEPLLAYSLALKATFG